jgi:hypothetical protein
MGQPTAAAPGPRRLRFFEARNRRAAAFNPVKAWWGQPRDLGARKPRCAGGGSRVDEASGRADGPEARERGHRTNPQAATPIAVPAVKMTRSWEPSPRRTALVPAISCLALGSRRQSGTDRSVREPGQAGA